MNIQKLILLGALLGAGNVALAGIAINITDLGLAVPVTESYSDPGNSLAVFQTSSPILAKYFGTSIQAGISDAGVFADSASATAVTNNLTATPALAAVSGPGVLIEFVFNGFLGPTGLVEWTSSVNSAGPANMFYSVETLVNGNIVLATLSIPGTATSIGELTLDTELPLTIVNRVRIGADAAGAGTLLSLDIVNTGRVVPVPGSIALLGIGLTGLVLARVRPRRAAGR
jgi:hypothetical protein